MDAQFLIERLEEAERWLKGGQRGDPNGAKAYQADKCVKDALNALRGGR